MSFWQDVMMSARERRQEAIDEARASGRLGATRLPLSIASDESLSDTFIGKCQIALEEGREQKAQDDYKRWMAANMDRLSEMVQESGTRDSGAWLVQQYFLETGKRP